MPSYKKMTQIIFKKTSLGAAYGLHCSQPAGVSQMFIFTFNVKLLKSKHTYLLSYLLSFKSYEWQIQQMTPSNLSSTWWTARDLWDGYWPAFISTGAAVESWTCWIGSHICLQPLTGGKLSGALVSEWRNHMFRSDREVGTTQQGNRLWWRRAFPARLRLWRLVTDGAAFSSSLRAVILCGFKSLLLRCCRGLKNCWEAPDPLSFRKRLSAEEPGYSTERFVSPHVSVSEP